MKRFDLDVEGLRATVVEPDAPNGRVLFCVPGGGMSRRYFDLPNGYSMAEHLAGRGFTVIAIDHPGVGDSPPPDDPWTLTPTYVADRDAAAVRELRTRYPGVAVGVGHSMGSGLTVVAQARNRCYDALGLYGWAHGDNYLATDLAAYLSPEEVAIVGDRAAIDAQVVELAKKRFGEPRPIGTTPMSDFLRGGMDVPPAGFGAIGESRSNMLAVCGLASMLKGIDQEVAAVDVPVFVGVGENDITGNVRSTAVALRSCPDITLYVLPGAGHNHNIAPNRIDLWDRLATWAEGLG